MSKQPAASASRPWRRFLILATGVLAARLWFIHWLLRAPLKPSDFHDTAFEIVHGVPKVTYYTNLREELPDFVDDFHLFRSRSNFSFDALSLIMDTPVRVYSMEMNCTRDTVICSPCKSNIDLDIENVETATVHQLLTTHRNYYAAFAKISTFAAETLWNATGLGFSIDSTQIEHAFIANFEHGIITAQVHANSLSASMAVQIMGKKTWLFIERSDYIRHWGANAAVGITLPTRTPNQKTKIYVYESMPGDVLFFPVTYAHAVYTHAGPNIMINYRKFNVASFLRQPFTYLTAAVHVFSNVVYKKIADKLVYRHPDDTTPNAVPDQWLTDVARRKIDAACDFKAPLAVEVDRQLVPLIKGAQ